MENLILEWQPITLELLASLAPKHIFLGNQPHNSLGSEAAVS